MRTVHLATLIAALLFAFASAAQAGTVSLVGNELDYSAAAGEANVVSVAPGPVLDPDTGTRAWLVTETGAPLVIGPGCTSVDSDTASCTDVPADPNCSSLEIYLFLGDGDDEAEASTGDPCYMYGLFVEGGDGNDTLSGAGFENTAAVRGGPGQDLLTGDGLIGGDGNDVLRGVAWENYLDGGPGADLVVGGMINDVILGGPGDDELYGRAGRGADDADLIRGGPGRDRISGGQDSDQLFGGRGRDTIFGGLGADVITGGPGRFDQLYGGSGRDRLLARDGYLDRLFGGHGFDSARIDARDRRRSIERLL